MINERGQVVTVKQEHFEAQAQGNGADGDVIPFLALRKSTLATPRIRNVRQQAESHYSRGMFPENILCLLCMFRKVQSLLTYCSRRACPSRELILDVC